jgi:hypothetical protein
MTELKVNRRQFLSKGLTTAVALGAGVTCLGGIHVFGSFKSQDHHQNPDGNITIYYVDSIFGNDKNDGRNPESAWKSLQRIEKTKYFPGDIIKFRRGSSFDRTLYIKDSGSKNNPILLTDYGAAELPAPSFTNTVFDPDNHVFGNCIRLQGSYVIVENLFFHHTVAELPVETAGGFLTMWELGAIYIEKNAKYCIIRNNEIFDCGAGIRSYGEHTIIENNYIHDCNRILKKYTWGPIAVWLGGDHQVVRYNRIFNYRAEDPRYFWGHGYGGGADGGAIEIDDARNNKLHIHIHHNYTKDNQGFLEVELGDVAYNPIYKNFWVHHNVSDDYQQFILWGGTQCRYENNTIIRRKVNANEWGVFNLIQDNSKNRIQNNIIVVENNVTIFNHTKRQASDRGNKEIATPDNIIRNNLYFAASGDLNFGEEDKGDSAIISNPFFLNYTGGGKATDFSLKANSPAINNGLNLGYKNDFAGVFIPQDSNPDIGAFEYNS